MPMNDKQLYVWWAHEQWLPKYYLALFSPQSASYHPFETQIHDYTALNTVALTSITMRFMQRPNDCLNVSIWYRFLGHNEENYHHWSLSQQKNYQKMLISRLYLLVTNSIWMRFKFMDLTTITHWLATSNLSTTFSTTWVVKCWLRSTKWVVDLLFSHKQSHFHFKYPKEIGKLEYLPGFAIRGLHYDIEKGLLLKLDSFLQVQLGSVYRGRTRLSDAEVLKLYRSRNVPLVYVEGASRTQVWILYLAFGLLSIDILSWIQVWAWENGAVSWFILRPWNVSSMQCSRILWEGTIELPSWNFVQRRAGQWVVEQKIDVDHFSAFLHIDYRFKY